MVWSPSVISTGLTDRLTVGRGLTVTVDAAVVDPYWLLAVIVYVVVTVGHTILDPFSATFPTPLSIRTVVAYCVVQERVVLSLSVIVARDEENVGMTGIG